MIKVSNENPSDQQINKWQWGIFVLIILIGAALRFGYINSLRTQPDFTMPAGDMAFHDYWARGLVTGEWPSPRRAEKIYLDKIPFLRPPGYPFFLAAVYKIFGLSYLVPRIVQALLGLINCALAFFLGRRWIDTLTGLIWAAFMAVYWVFIYFEGDLNAPVLIIFLLLVMLGALGRWRQSLRWFWLCFAAVCAGAGALTAPNLMLIIPVIACWIAWITWRRVNFKRAVIHFILFGLIAAAAISPATIRNYRVAGEPILISCNGAITLYAGNNENSNGVSAKIPDLEQMGLQGWGWFWYPRIVQAVSEEQHKTMSYSDVSRYFSAKAWDYIKAHPGQTAGRVAKKALLFWGPVEIASNKEIQLEKAQSPILRYSPGFAYFLAPALVGLAIVIYRHLSDRKRHRITKGSPLEARWELAVLLMLVFITYYISFLPFLVSSRFRTPAVPFILLAGAFSLRCCLGYLRQRAWSRVIGWVIIVGCTFGLVSQPVVGYSVSTAIWHVVQGEAYYNQGQMKEAVGEFQKALELNPDFARVHQDLALLYLRIGKLEQAEVHAKKLLNLEPDSAEAHYVMGMAMLHKGRLEEGARYLKESMKLNPNDAYVYQNLGLYYARKKDWVHANEMFNKARQLRPDDAIILKLQGRMYISNQQLEVAVPLMKHCVEVAPDDPEAHFILGVAYEKRSQFDLARKELQRTVELAPDFSNARQLLGQLQNR